MEQSRKYFVSRYHIILLVIVISLLITTGGFLYYLKEENRFKDQLKQELKTIAEMKINLISTWFKDEFHDAKIISENYFLNRMLNDWIIKKKSEAKENIEKIISIIIEEHGYRYVILTDSLGQVLISSDNVNIDADTVLTNKIKSAIANRKIETTELYRLEGSDKVLFYFVVPVFSDNKNLLSLICFCLEADNFLNPLIKNLPIELESAETVLYRQEGEEILILSELKYRSQSAGRLRIPLTAKDRPAVKAILGHKGLIEGIDYRGIEVLAYVSPINGTNWFLTTKIDKSEIYSELYFLIGQVTITTLMLMLISGIGIAFIYNYRQRNIFKELYNKETKLWESQEEFKVTIDSIGDGVITTDTKGTIKYMNRMAEELTGWKIRDAKGRRLEEVYKIKSEETNKPMLNAVQKVLDKGFVKGLANHTILISKNGTEIPVMDTGAPIYDSHGSIIGVVLAFQDETENRRKERILRESEKLFSTTFRTSPVGIGLIRMTDGLIIEANDSLLKILALNREEIIGKTLRECNFFEDASALDELIKMFNDAGKFTNYEIRLLTKNNQVRTALVSAERLYVDDDKFIFSVHDITSRKEAEEALKISEERYRSLVELSPDAIFINRQNKVSFVNNAAIKLFGVQRSDELIGKSPFDLFEPAYHNLMEERIKVLLDGFPVPLLETRIIRLDGTLVDVEVSAASFNDAGGKAIQVILRDITNRKRAEKELIAAKEKAEEINRVKSYFFANMSHELRTPFVGIIGYAEILHDMLEDEEARELAAGILDSSRRLTETLTKILALTKLEFEKQEVNISETNLNEVIDLVYRQFVKAAEQKGLQCKKSINSNIILKTDSKLLTDILINLVSNAVKFTNKGEIEIICGVMKTNGKEVVQIEVKDTGIGIPKEKQALIWQEFRQISEGHSRSFEGMGLGLSIVKKYTELIGGTISVRSEVGRGTLFLLQLPYEGAKQENNLLINSTGKKAESIKKPENEIVKKKILFVEDDKASRDILKRFLSGYYDVYLAGDHSSAMELLNKEKFDLILMDINLGKGMDGVSLALSIRKISGYEKIPIVAVTAYASNKDRAEFLSRGMNYYISKPFMWSEMLNLLEGIFKDIKKQEIG